MRFEFGFTPLRALDVQVEVAIVTVDIFDSFGKRAMTATLPVQDGFLADVRGLIALATGTIYG